VPDFLAVNLEVEDLVEDLLECLKQDFGLSPVEDMEVFGDRDWFLTDLEGSSGHLGVFESSLDVDVGEFTFKNGLGHPRLEGAGIRNDFIIGSLGHHLVATGVEIVLRTTIVVPESQDSAQNRQVLGIAPLNYRKQVLESPV
jgi:hypothetical protein